MSSIKNRLRFNNNRFNPYDNDDSNDNSNKENSNVSSGFITYLACMRLKLHCH